MKAASEIYKGIEFVRIFSLPDEQKVLFWQTFSRHKIIKILKDETLLSDCVQYTDYLEWYSAHIKADKQKENKAPVMISPVLVQAIKSN